MSRFSKLAALAASIRLSEVMVLQGAPLIGLAFSAAPIAAEKLPAVILFAVASFFLVAHVFTLNDWADFTRGLYHSNGAMSRLESRSISPGRLLWFSISLLTTSLLLFLLLSKRCFAVATIIALLGVCYSHPSFNGKSIPIVSSLLHFFGGLLHFLLGYVVFLPIDKRGGYVALFFALTFTAGHLNQELRDFDVDQRTGARTNAIAFGKQRSFLAGLVLFAAAYIYLFFLGWIGDVPRPAAILAILICPVHIVWGLRILRRNLTPESVQSFRIGYRFFYALIGIVMMVTVIYR